jgi:hypothetical protein
MDNGSLTVEGLLMGGQSLGSRQDWIIGGKHHGGALVILSWVTVFSGVRQQNFAGAKSFAGATFASKTAPAKFKMRQQIFIRASKIINPTSQ